jgi:hypothetical protein
VFEVSNIRNLIASVSVSTPVEQVTICKDAVFYACVIFPISLQNRKYAISFLILSTVYRPYCIPGQWNNYT